MYKKAHMKFKNRRPMACGSCSIVLMIVYTGHRPRTQLHLIVLSASRGPFFIVGDIPTHFLCA